MVALFFFATEVGCCAIARRTVVKRPQTPVYNRSVQFRAPVPGTNFQLLCGPPAEGLLGMLRGCVSLQRARSDVSCSCVYRDRCHAALHSQSYAIQLLGLLACA